MAFVVGADLVAGGGGVAGRVAGSDGEGVSGAGCQAGDGCGGAGDGGGGGGAVVDVVGGDADVVGGGGPGQGDGAGGLAGDGEVRRSGGQGGVRGAAGDLDGGDGRVVGAAVDIERDVQLPVSDRGGEGAVTGGELAAGGEDVERGQHHGALDAHVEAPLAAGGGPVLHHLQRDLVGAVGDVEPVARPGVEVVALVQRVVGGGGDGAAGRPAAEQRVIPPAPSTVSTVSRPHSAGAVSERPTV